MYFEPPDKRRVVDTRTTPVFEASAPRDLFATPRPGGSDVSRDGQRMLVNLPAAETAPNQRTLVLNWTAGLKR